MRQAIWLGKGHYATDMEGNVYYRYDEEDNNPILLETRKTNGGFRGCGRRYSNTADYYLYVLIGHSTRAVHVIIARNYPEICGEWFEGAIVHHKNGIKQDNRPENLQVMSTREHSIWHMQTKIRYNGVEYASFTMATSYTGDPYEKIYASNTLEILKDS